MILEYRVSGSSSENSINPDEQLKDLREAMKLFLKFYCITPDDQYSVEGNKHHVSIKPLFLDTPIRDLSSWNRELPKAVTKLERVDRENGYVDLKIDDCLYTVFFEKPKEISKGKEDQDSD